MGELELFSQVLQYLYDCALDADLWPIALEKICVFVQGSMSHLYFHEIDAGVTVFHSSIEYEMQSELYNSTYAKLNPLFPATLFLELEKVHCVNDVLPIEEFCESRFYQEWARPQGILDALHVNLERSATGAIACNINRRASDGLFDQAAMSRFALLVPHIRRAAQISNVVAFHRGAEATLKRTLDGLATAVLLVGRDRRVVYANVAASEMLTAGDILKAPNGRVAAVDLRAHQALVAAIDASSRGDAGLDLKGGSIALSPDNTSSWVVHVLPLTSGNRQALNGGQAIAALFVRQATVHAPAPLEVVARRYKLTAGEVRVLAVVTAADSVATMANVLGVSETTVKTHLHKIFTKTGTRRQADIVKLLVGYATPLRA